MATEDRITLRIPRLLAAQLTDAAGSAGQSRNQYIMGILYRWLGEYVGTGQSVQVPETGPGDE